VETYRPPLCNGDGRTACRNSAGPDHADRGCARAGSPGATGLIRRCRRAGHRGGPVCGQRQSQGRARERSEGGLRQGRVHPVARSAKPVQGAPLRQDRPDDRAILDGRRQPEHLGQDEAHDARLRHGVRGPVGHHGVLLRLGPGVLRQDPAATPRLRHGATAGPGREARCREDQGLRERQPGDDPPGRVAQRASGSGELRRRRLLGRAGLHIDEREGRGDRREAQGGGRRGPTRPQRRRTQGKARQFLCRRAEGAAWEGAGHVRLHRDPGRAGRSDERRHGDVAGGEPQNGEARHDRDHRPRSEPGVRREDQRSRAQPAGGRRRPGERPDVRDPFTGLRRLPNTPGPV
ncbi:MAG: Catalase KatE, partial [uncultured Microvirga sp.]